MSCRTRREHGVLRERSRFHAPGMCLWLEQPPTGSFIDIILSCLLACCFSLSSLAKSISSVFLFFFFFIKPLLPFAVRPGLIPGEQERSGEGGRQIEGITAEGAGVSQAGLEQQRTNPQVSQGRSPCPEGPTRPFQQGSATESAPGAPKQQTKFLWVFENVLGDSGTLLPGC